VGKAFHLDSFAALQYICSVPAARRRSIPDMAAVHELDPLVGMRVLVVEDHDDSRDLLAQVLEHVGARVIASPSADEALAHLDHVDVVVTDIAMPVHDGFWLLRQIRQHYALTPVIAVSGFSDLQAKALREASFTRVLRKPIDPWVLCREVANAIRPRSP
jgi:CheY-like chemotaxis protein